MSTDATIDVESQEIESEVVGDGGMLALVSKAEIDMQIATAKRFPRNIKKFMTESTSLACLDSDVAGECYYRLERKDKFGKVKVIEGPSARLAEIAASAWGNCRAAARIIDEGERFVVAQGAFIDLERNVAITYESRRRITDKSGRRFSDDMIGVTANAACSIALRNAVFKGIPKAFWVKSYEEAVKTYRGDQKTLAERRTNMLAYFAKSGVPEDRVLAKIGKPSVEAIDLDDLVRLKGFATAIKDGDTTIEEAFPAPQTPCQPLDPNRSKSEQLADQLKGNVDAAKQPVAETQPSNPAKETTPSQPETAKTETPLPQQPPAEDEAVTVAQWIDDVGQLNTIGECENARRMVPETISEGGRKKIFDAIDARENVIRGTRGGRSNGTMFDTRPSATEQGA